MPHIQLAPADFKSSVVAVPPIALTAQHEIAEIANQALINHIERGGVRIVLFGGNANLYHYGLGLYRDALQMMAGMQSEQIRIITSIGPDFGKMLDQTQAVLDSGLKNVMLLPTVFPSDPTGVASGARAIADKLGFGVILYLKREHYVDPGELARLVNEGVVCFVKYAVERVDASKDAYLDKVLAEVGIDVVASGMGETPLADHLGRRNLTTFTSGAVCIAPAAAMRLLSLYKSGQHQQALSLSQPFLEFERVRAHIGGMKVLHDGVTLSAIADMGPLLPMVSNITAGEESEVRRVVDGLLAAEKACLQSVAT